MGFVPTARTLFPPGTIETSVPIAPRETDQVCGGVTLDGNEQFVLAGDDRPTVLRYTGDPTLADSFVFVRGPYVDEPPLKCGNCGRDLTRYVLESQVVRITFECPDCEHLTSV